MRLISLRCIWFNNCIVDIGIAWYFILGDCDKQIQCFILRPLYIPCARYTGFLLWVFWKKNSNVSNEYQSCLPHDILFFCDLTDGGSGTNSADRILSWVPWVHSAWTRAVALLWHHNERDGVSNHRRLHCLLICWLRKYQSSASLAFVRGIHRWPVNSRTKGQ